MRVKWDGKNFKSTSEPVKYTGNFTNIWIFSSAQMEKKLV